MYRCLNCGRSFSEPVARREDYGLPGGWYEEWAACPFCKESGTVVSDDEGL